MAGKVKRLGGVEPRIAGGQPVAVEVVERGRAAPADALADVERAHFEMQPARMHAFRVPKAVRGYLVGRGVASSRIQVEGRGEREPVARNDTEAGRAQNRRVEVLLAEQAG